MSRTTLVSLGGASQLAACQWGPSDGSPLFFLHGTPGSRLLRHPEDSYDRLGIRVITYDRPGYGQSTRLPDRRMVDSATHIAAIADALDIHAFAVVGVSGGGGHALAAAALLPQRVSKCATIVGLGPAQAAGLDFYAGMPPHDRATWTRIANEGDEYLETIVYPDVLEFVSSLPSNTDLPQPDRDLLFEAFSEGLRPGPAGFVDDYTSTLAPWGFELSSVMCPTRVMVAKEDTLTRLHGLWIAEHIPAAEVIVVPGDHFGPREVEEEQLLGWLIESS